MAKCILCEQELTSGINSEEHIIPQAIGGKLCVKGLLCINCNSMTGKWDAVVCQQLNPLSLFFGVIRDRGKVPPQIFSTTAGERLKAHVDGSFSLEKPNYQEMVTEHGIEIKIAARSDYELSKILKGVKRKYPKISLAEIKQKAVHIERYPEGLILKSLKFGGEKAGRSIVKTALSFAFNMGVDVSLCETALKYLKGSDQAPFGYYSHNIVVGRPVGVPMHCVSISGNPAEKLLLAYVEYFGFLRMIVCLSDQYLGEEISKTYAFNPATGGYLDVNIRITLRRGELQELYGYKMFWNDELEKALSAVIEPRLKETQRIERQRVIDEAIDWAIQKSSWSEGAPFTEEINKEICSAIAERMASYLQHKNGLF